MGPGAWVTSGPHGFEYGLATGCQSLLRCGFEKAGHGGFAAQRFMPPYAGRGHHRQFGLLAPGSVLQTTAAGL